MAPLNTTTILVAVAASYAFGAIWYIGLSKPWLASVEKTPTELKLRMTGAVSPFVVTFVAQVVMATMLSGLIGHMGGPSVRAGMITAGLIWLGFIMPTMAANHAFQGAKRSLTVIDGLHWLGVLLIQGAVIGAFGS